MLDSGDNGNRCRSRRRKAEELPSRRTFWRQAKRRPHIFLKIWAKTSATRMNPGYYLDWFVTRGREYAFSIAISPTTAIVYEFDYLSLLVFALASFLLLTLLGIDVNEAPDIQPTWRWKMTKGNSRLSVHILLCALRATVPVACLIESCPQASDPSSEQVEGIFSWWVNAPIQRHEALLRPCQKRAWSSP